MPLPELLARQEEYPLSLGEALKGARKAYRSWNLKKQASSMYLGEEEQAYLQSVSIMMLMQMAPIRLPDYESPQPDCSQKGTVQKLLYYVLSFFTLGNEIRLRALEEDRLPERQRLVEFLYLRAIELYCACLPVENNFVNSILSSYNRAFSNFGADSLDYSALEDITPEEAAYFTGIQEAGVESEPLHPEVESRQAHSESPEELPLKSKQQPSDSKHAPEAPPLASSAKRLRKRLPSPSEYRRPEKALSPYRKTT